MSNLIDKDAVIAEIDELSNDEFRCSSYDEATGFQNALKLVKDFIDTLEVKEIDLDKEIDLVEDRYHGFYSLSKTDIIDVAKHFFELGLKEQKGEEV